MRQQIRVTLAVPRPLSPIEMGGTFVLYYSDCRNFRSLSIHHYVEMINSYNKEFSWLLVIEKHMYLLYLHFSKVLITGFQ